MSDQVDARRFILGVLLGSGMALPVAAFDCDYLIYLHETAVGECNAGIVYDGAKYQPCDLVSMQEGLYRACTAKDTSCISVAAPVRFSAGQDCVALEVTNVCAVPLRLYVEGVEKNPLQNNDNIYDLQGESAVVSCCGDKGCPDFRIFHAEPLN